MNSIQKCLARLSLLTNPALTSLTDDEREILAALLKKMGPSLTTGSKENPVNANTTNKPVRPEGFERLLQRTCLTHNRKQGGTESGTVVEDSRLIEMLASLSSLTDDEREMLTELLKKMG